MDGKADGRSYFYSQNGGYQSRAINPGMSKRVKESPEYANTRRNNAEYGVAAKFAGNMISTFSGHWRFMLHKNIIGKMIKDVHAMITSNPGVWGQRSITGAQNKMIITLLNKYGKRSLPEEFDQMFTQDFVWVKGDANDTISIDDNNGIQTEEGWGEQLRSAGATGCELRLVAMKIPYIEWSSANNEYVEYGGVQLKTLDSYPYYLGDGDDYFGEDYELGNGWDFDQYDQPLAIGLLCLPFKVIGSQKYTMQELCSFKFVCPTPL